MITQKLQNKCTCHSINACLWAKLSLLFSFFLLLLFSCNQIDEDSQSFKNEVASIANIEIEDMETKEINETIRKLVYKSDSLAKMPNLEPLKAAYAYKIGSLYMRRRTLDSAKNYFRQAHSFFKETRNQYNSIRAKLYSDYGYTKFLSDKDVAEANKFLNEAIAIVIADSIKNELSPYEKLIVLTNASEISFVMNKYREAIDFNHLALSYVPQVKKGPTRSHYTFRIYYELFNLQTKLLDPSTDSLAKYLRRIKIYTPNDRYKRFYHKLKGLYFLETNELDSAITYFTKAHEFDLRQMEKLKGNGLFTDYYNFLEIQLNLAHALLLNGEYEKAKEQLTFFEENYYAKSNKIKLDDDILELYHIASADYAKHFKDLEKYSYHNQKLIDLIDQDLQKTNHDSYDKISSLNTIHLKKNSLSDLTKNFQKETKRLFYSRSVLVFLGLIIILASAFAGNFFLQRKNTEIVQEKERMALKNKLIKTQLEPRFILNTLSNLNYLIGIDKQKDAIAFLDNFGELLRNTIQQTQDDLLPIEDEIQFLTSYCQLQKITHNKNFEYKIIIDEGLDVEGLAISPFLIQPYVENAILDPTNNYDKDCKLEMVIKKGDGEIFVEISVDNQNIQNQENSRLLINAISKERFELLSKQFGTNKEFRVSDEKQENIRLISIWLPYKEI